MSVNKVILIGRLGADPEVRYTQGGQAVANFNLATHETWKDREGQPQEKTEWHRIVVWGRQAETCGEYLRKGREAYVEGRLETRQWQDREGNDRYTTEIKAQSVRFLGGRQNDSGGYANDGGERPQSNGGQSMAPSGGQQAAPSGGQQTAPSGGQQAAPTNGGPQVSQSNAMTEQNTAPPAPSGPQGGEFNDDDIPF